MYKKIWILAFFNAFALNAQEFELGKVSKAELEEKKHSLEPSAEAAILFESGTTYMDYNEKEGFTLVTETDVRIKIYTTEGYNWASKIIPYYVATNPKEKVDISKAVTYNLVNGAIEKTKLKSEGEFDEQVNKYWAQKKLTMPNVKEGSVVEYRYTVRSPYISTFPTWNFQSTIPVNYSKYITRIPEFYTYSPNFRGYIFPKKEQRTQQKSYNYTSKEKVGSFSSERTQFNAEKIEYKEDVITYTSENMPSMKEEDYVSNVKNYISSIEHELSSVKYPNSPVKNLSQTWESLVKTIYDSDDFGNELRKTGYFEDDLQALIAGASSEGEKAAIIFNYVKSRMNWNGFNGYGCNDGVRKAYKDKVGNVAEINLMLTAMLRYAGIKANPVLVSTRENGIALFPNRTAFNYVITAIEIGNSIVLLDATAKNSMPNILPIRALNWDGRIIREDGSFTTVDLMPEINSKENINIIASLDSEGKVTGKARDQYFDYNAFVYRETFGGVSQETYLQNLEKRYSGIEIEEYSTANDKDLSKPIVENYSFVHSNLSEIVGDKIYFSPMLFFTQKENPFKQEKREYPVDFIYPHQDKYAFTINIPDGYVVESLPQPLSLAMEENIGSFKFNISASGKQIQVVASMDINHAAIPQNYYDTLKDFYKKVIEKHNEKIVLKKV